MCMCRYVYYLVRTKNVSRMKQSCSSLHQEQLLLPVVVVAFALLADVGYPGNPC